MNKRQRQNYFSKWRSVFYFALMILIIIHFFYYPKDNGTVNQIQLNSNMEENKSQSLKTILVDEDSYNLTEEITLSKMEQLIERQEKENEALQEEDKTETLKMIVNTHNVIIILSITLLIIIYMSSLFEKVNINDKRKIKHESCRLKSNNEYSLLINEIEEEEDIYL